IFWKRIMRLSPDSCIVNIAKDRRIIAVMSNADWNSQSDAQKNTYRDSVRNVYGLTAEDRIYVTTGKNDFYKFDLVYPTIAKGIEAFEQNGVDPWYAQAILLIESPGQLKKSRAGAYGPFQLMPAVARAQGLTVNKYRDDREDFEKSAYGASQLLKRICIPEAKRILEKHQIQYNESDLWFRLYVLHVYHAGALNVDAVTAKINTNDGRDLIRQMWINTAANFGNNSQNYSQLALASQLILHELVYERCEYIFDCASNN
ncbi:MAG: hypothetical protein EP322_03715, partial [Bacteroidetes bacterium]